MTRSERAPPSRRAGALLGLGAALLFGLSTPLAKRLLEDVAPQLLAGLFYLGAGIALSAAGAIRRNGEEAPLRRRDVVPLIGVVALGGVIGPVLLLVGLTRVTALAGALLLNLEAVFTIVLAVVVFREHVGRRVALAVVLILSGAFVLKTAPGALGADVFGVLAIAGACLCWAVDNNLTQRLSVKDPLAIARMKALGAGAFNLVVAFALGGALPSFTTVLGAAIIGSLSYGLSLVLDTYALRLVGAAREAAYFATAPFVGAIASAVWLGERIGPFEGGAMALMAAGVVVMLREQHAHRHTHDEQEHEHAHVHDEHHRHAHGPADPPGEPHAHPHRHESLVHEHPHAPDAHHRHRH